MPLHPDTDKSCPTKLASPGNLDWALMTFLKYEFFSWFWLHNETVNIWTHLIGFLIFVYCLLLVIWSPPREIHSLYELFPLVIQLLSYMVSTVVTLVCVSNLIMYHYYVRCACYPRLSSTPSRVIPRKRIGHGDTLTTLASCLPFLEPTFRSFAIRLPVFRHGKKSTCQL